MSTVFKRVEVDSSTGEVTTTMSIQKKVLNKETFIQTYFKDLGVLLKCTKGQIDFLISCITLGYIEFDTNEIVLNSSRRDQLASKADLNINSIYVFINGLKKKNILVVDEQKRMFLNPKLFFYGSELERQKMFTLSINYEICEDC
jgi:hypothetical protein